MERVALLVDLGLQRLQNVERVCQITSLELCHPMPPVTAHARDEAVTDCVGVRLTLLARGRRRHRVTGKAGGVRVPGEDLTEPPPVAQVARLALRSTSSHACGRG